ncbi:MAG TPA: T9SS type A sorting domain-containing protein [Saprospiraceae bacterium]|nr:T9SS type A sorting domain-containing protein [Saprospiraceae bacterium]HMP24721.1 T9SS type A sorting domain-containing protein [Saprospiraceae bacterium]
MYLLAQQAGHRYGVGGQYGFLTDHANNLPPRGYWNFEHFSDGYWDQEMGLFSVSGFNNIMFTIENFIQHSGLRPSERLGWYNNGADSPFSLSLRIIDHVNEQLLGPRIYIYENWPAVNPDGSGLSFPVSAQAFSEYHNIVLGDFHNWWLELQDLIIQARPELNVRMIPVGPIISKLLTETPLVNIPVTEWFYDGVHGTPSLYFLAGLIHYMAIYQEPAPADFRDIAATIHPMIQNDYNNMVNFIWQELQQFKDKQGKSRVFLERDVTTGLSKSADAQIILYPNPVNDVLYLDHNTVHQEMVHIYNNTGTLLISSQERQINVRHLPSGLYVALINNQVIKFIKNRHKSHHKTLNPC